MRSGHNRKSPSDLLFCSRTAWRMDEFPEEPSILKVCEREELQERQFTQEIDGESWILVETRLEADYPYFNVEKIVQSPQDYQDCSHEQIQQIQQVLALMMSPKRLSIDQISTLCQLQCFVSLHRDIILNSSPSEVKELLVEILNQPPLIGNFKDDADESPVMESLISTVKPDYFSISSNSLSKEFPTLDDAKSSLGESILSSENLGENLSSSTIRILNPGGKRDRIELVEKISTLSNLFLRDFLNNGKETLLTGLLKSFLQKIISSHVPQLITRLVAHEENLSAIRKFEQDPRVHLIKGAQNFIADYSTAHGLVEMKKNFDCKLRWKVSAYPDSHPLLIMLMCQKVSQRSNSKLLVENFQILRHCSSKELDKILVESREKLFLEFANHLIPLQPSGHRSELDLSLINLIKESLEMLISIVSDSKLWVFLMYRASKILQIIQKSRQRDSSRSKKRTSRRSSRNSAWIKRFDSRNSRPDLLSQEEREEIDISRNLGKEISLLVHHLNRLISPQGLSSIIVKIGTHVVNSFMQSIGNEIWNELKTPISAEKILDIVNFILALLWDQTANNEYLFVGDMTFFKNLDDARLLSEFKRECVVELVEAANKTLEMLIPNAIQWMTPSMRSIRSSIHSLVQILAEISQSPQLLQFTLLQYFVIPLLQATVNK